MKGTVMKKIEMVTMTFTAMFALTATMTSAASAEVTLLAEWLVTGAGVTTLTSVSSLGRMLFEDKTLDTAYECEGTFDGSVGPNGEDETTELLTEGGIAVTQANPLTTANGGCKILAGCTSPLELYAAGFPWHTLLYLVESTSKFKDFLFRGVYVVTCTILGIKSAVECIDTNASFEVLASTEGAEATGEVTPKSNCGGTSSGVWQFVGANHTLTLAEVPVIPSST
jgi:hypothetical protein